MDPRVRRFRKQAREENRGRAGRSRRYSRDLGSLAGETIGQWLERGIQNMPDGRFLTATQSERMIEFRLNGTTNVPLNELIDSRFHRSTAQFVAAGSFGLLQATLMDWDHAVRRPTLNAEFNLENRCLTELMSGPNREEEAFLLGAVRHSYGEATTLRQECEASPCDQIDWAKRWSNVFRSYNSNGEKYKTSNRTCLKEDSSGNCRQRKPNGLNDIIERGSELYYAR